MAAANHQSARQVGHRTNADLASAQDVSLRRSHPTWLSIDELHAAGRAACIASAGVQLVEQQDLEATDSLKVAIDLNAVPPSGIGGLASGLVSAGIGRSGISAGPGPDLT